MRPHSFPKNKREEEFDSIQKGRARSKVLQQQLENPQDEEPVVLLNKQKKTQVLPIEGIKSDANASDLKLLVPKNPTRTVSTAVTLTHNDKKQTLVQPVKHLKKTSDPNPKKKQMISTTLTTTTTTTLTTKSLILSHISHYKQEEHYTSEEEDEDITESETEEKCQHKNRIMDGATEICRDCGEEICFHQSNEQEWRFYGDADNKHDEDPARVSFKKVVEKGIKKDLEAYDLPPNVVQRADEIYQSATQGDIKRSCYRKGIMFACVFEAYKELDSAQVPEDLQQLFQIKHKHMSKGMRYLADHGKKRKKIYINATHYVPRILQQLNMREEHNLKILKIYEKVKNKSDILNRANPQSVSSGLVYYYLKKKNVDLTDLKFGKIVDLSQITIDRISDEIERVLG